MNIEMERSKHIKCSENAFFNELVNIAWMMKHRYNYLPRGFPNTIKCSEDWPDSGFLYWQQYFKNIFYKSTVA